MNNWHQLDTTAVLHRLGAIDNYGLSQTEASQRLSQYGPNELTERTAKSLWKTTALSLPALVISLA
jgi:Ca2+-transporting ATPase